MPYKDPAALKLYRQLHYQKNKALYADRMRIARDKKKARFQEYKKTLKCELCGENRTATLDFHHTDPSSKEVEVADALRCWGWDRLMAEVKKCQVLCANCHRCLHAEAESTPTRCFALQVASPSLECRREVANDTPRTPQTVEGTVRGGQQTEV